MVYLGLYSVLIRGGRTVFAYFIGHGRPVEVKEGGNISMKLGHLIIICYIAQLFIFISTFFDIS